MFKLASALVIAATISSASAFATTKITARATKTHLKYEPQPTPPYDMSPPDMQPDMQAEPIGMTYDRALDCANNVGMCDIDEVLDLSEELDEYQGCFVENGPEACEDEIEDRQDLSEALLVQVEMRQHQRYIEEGNSFPSPDVNNGDGGQGQFWGDDVQEGPPFP